MAPPTASDCPTLKEQPAVLCLSLRCMQGLGSKPGHSRHLPCLIGVRSNGPWMTMLHLKKAATARRPSTPLSCQSRRRSRQPGPHAEGSANPHCQHTAWSSIACRRCAGLVCPWCHVTEGSKCRQQARPSRVVQVQGHDCTAGLCGLLRSSPKSLQATASMCMMLLVGSRQGCRHTCSAASDSLVNGLQEAGAHRQLRA